MIKTVEFDLKGKRITGELVKSNPKTVLVKVRKVNKTFTIKRHREKHHVMET